MWGVPWFWWAFVVVLWVVFVYLTFTLAASKGRSPILWTILAIFLPIITVIILLVLPPADGARRTY